MGEDGEDVHGRDFPTSKCESQPVAAATTISRTHATVDIPALAAATRISSASAVERSISIATLQRFFAAADAISFLRASESDADRALPAWLAAAIRFFFVVFDHRFFANSDAGFVAICFFRIMKFQAQFKALLPHQPLYLSIVLSDLFTHIRIGNLKPTKRIALFKAEAEIAIEEQVSGNPRESRNPSALVILRDIPKLALENNPQDRRSASVSQGIKPISQRLILA